MLYNIIALTMVHTHTHYAVTLLIMYVCGNKTSSMQRTHKEMKIRTDNGEGVEVSKSVCSYSSDIIREEREIYYCTTIMGGCSCD